MLTRTVHSDAAHNPKVDLLMLIVFFLPSYTEAELSVSAKVFLKKIKVESSSAE